MISRTMHGIAYDEIHDEIVIPSPFAEAILFFRGEADGEEAPIRVIQGSNTHLDDIDALAADPEHNEIFVPLRRQGAVLVFRRDVGGNVAPIRVLRSSNVTFTPYRLAIDPENNLLVVANNNPPAIFMFDRTAQGDVAPKATIAGPQTGFMQIQAVEVYPPTRSIVVEISDTVAASTEGRAKPGFIGVWNYSDEGDVAPRAVLRGPDGLMIRPRGMAINPEHKEIYVADMRRNALFTFSFPEIF